MGSPELAVAVGRKHIIGTATIEAVQQAPEAPPRRKFDIIDESEANHLTVGKVLGMDFSFAYSGKNSGYVIPDGYHATIASAHDHGNGHDRWLVEEVQGDNYDYHSGLAEDIIADNIELRNDYAAALSEEGSMDRGRINTIYAESRRRQEERKTPKARIFIRSERGTQVVENIKIQGGTVALPDIVFAFTPKPEKKKEKDQTEAVAKAYDIFAPRNWSRKSDAERSEVVKENDDPTQDDAQAVLNETESVVNAEAEAIRQEQLTNVRTELAEIQGTDKQEDFVLAA